LRPYPLGLRFSGKNMSPLPGWLSGCQHVALNMSNVDLPNQLHFALFHGSGGFLLKPPEMLVADSHADKKEKKRARRHSAHDDVYWPPPRQTVHQVAVEILSLHNLPKRGEQRPRYIGSRGACHQFAPELSGSASRPDYSDPSSPSISVSLHPIGGFCAVSKTLPLPAVLDTSTTTSIVKANGLRAEFGEKIFCVAAEPHAAFLRVRVADGIHEPAYATAVLGRIKPGNRVLQMRSPLGTRIELCFVLVRVHFDSLRNIWPSARQARMNAVEYFDAIDNLNNVRKELAEVKGRADHAPTE